MWKTILRCIALATVFAAIAAHAEEKKNCHVGAYRMSDGGIVDIAPSEGKTLRWRRFDGTTGALTQGGDGSWSSTYGWTRRPDGIRVAFGSCDHGTIVFDGIEGRRIPLQATDTRFTSQGVVLAGRLVMPPGRDRVPIVVLLHGAEHDSALEFYALQRLLPAQGVGAFVYDKRGTGASGGTYTQDFELLASDAIAAMHEARRLAGARASRVGYQAGSQGGWVAPIAASREPVDFVIVCFGLAVSVVDEDQEEAALEMRLEGHDPETIAKALEIVRAADVLFASSFTEGFQEFDRVRAKYRDEPWYKDVHGNFTHFILGASSEDIRAKGPAYLVGTPFLYDPMPTLRELDVPQLWILGGMDLEAPSEETSRRLRQLIAAGKPITLALYPEAEHGMTAFETKPGGERVSTRYMPGYFEMMRDFALHGRLDRTYGTSEVVKPEAPTTIR